MPRLLPGFQIFEHHTLLLSAISQLLAISISAFHFPLSTFHFRLALYRVHEGTLDVVEKNNANKQNRQSEAGAVAEIDPVERAAAEIGVAEGLDDRRHWVCQDEPAETAAANH